MRMIRAGIVSFVRTVSPSIDFADQEVNLSQLPLDYFPGRLCLTTFREYCILAPFTALVLKRCIPHTILDPGPYAADAHKFEVPDWVKPGPAVPLTLVSFPALDCMRNSPQVAVPLRSSGNALGLFGTLRNYAEWLLIVFVVEAYQRSKENSAFTVADSQALAQIFTLEGCEHADQPRAAVVTEVCAALEAGSLDWEQLEKRMKVSR